MIARTYKLHGKEAGSAPAASRPVNNGPHYPDTREQRLSGCEIKELGMASALAFEKYCEELAAGGDSIQAVARAAGMTMKAAQDEWRHGQVKSATQGRANGLRQMMRADFRNVKGRFLDIAGLTEAAFHTLVRTGETNGEPVENMEQSARAVLSIMKQVEAFFREQSPDNVKERAAAFFVSLAQWKERKAGKRWTEWESKAQWNLYFTIKNRLADMKRKAGGDVTPAVCRNKKQRRESRGQKTEGRGQMTEQRAVPAQSARTGFTVELDFGGERGEGAEV